VQLDPANITGSYTSKVFDSGVDVPLWTNIFWTAGGPYGHELPDYGGVETVLGGVNMSGNALLMHMNEPGGTIVDSSGSGNNGTSSGGVAYGVSGKFDRALGFDGVNDYIRILDDASIR